MDTEDINIKMRYDKESGCLFEPVDDFCELIDVKYESYKRRDLVIIPATDPDGIPVRRICRNAFKKCPELESVVIPKCITEIYGEAFSECRLFKNIYYRGNKEDWGKVTFVEYVEGKPKDDVALFYYSESKPSDEDDYWHYKSENNPVKWGKEK